MPVELTTMAQPRPVLPGCAPRLIIIKVLSTQGHGRDKGFFILDEVIDSSL